MLSSVSECLLHGPVYNFPVQFGNASDEQSPFQSLLDDTSHLLFSTLDTPTISRKERVRAIIHCKEESTLSLFVPLPNLVSLNTIKLSVNIALGLIMWAHASTKEALALWSLSAQSQFENRKKQNITRFRCFHYDKILCFPSVAKRLDVCSILCTNCQAIGLCLPLSRSIFISFHYLSFSIFVSLSLYISLSLSLYVCTSIYIYIYVAIYVSLSLSRDPSLSVRSSVRICDLTNGDQEPRKFTLVDRKNSELKRSHSKTDHEDHYPSVVWVGWHIVVGVLLALTHRATPCMKASLKAQCQWLCLSSLFSGIMLRGGTLVLEKRPSTATIKVELWFWARLPGVTSCFDRILGSAAWHSANGSSQQALWKARERRHPEVQAATPVSHAWDDEDHDPLSHELHMQRMLIRMLLWELPLSVELPMNFRIWSWEYVLCLTLS